MSSTADARPRVLTLCRLHPAVEAGLDARFRVLRLHEAGEGALGEAAHELRGLAASALAGPVGAELLDRLPALEIVANYGVGYDNLDAAAAAARGVVVTNTPGVLDEEVADTALALLLMAVRRLPQAERYLRAGSWLEGSFPLSPTLRGRRVGIFGLGRIGKAIARRVEAFGLEIAYHGRTRQADVPYAYHASLLDLARACDVLVVIAPGGGATRHAVDAAVLDALGPDGVLVNVARGSLVDEAALIAALREGRILAAGLDVFEDEPRVPEALIGLDNAVLLPHVGSASVATRRAMGELVVANLAGWFEGRGPLTPVPETPWPFPRPA